MIDEEEDSVRNVQRSMDSANLGDFFLSSKRPILFFRFFKDCKTVRVFFFFFFKCIRRKENKNKEVSY